MKVQDVKKECLATVGLTVEFSNSEVGSLSRLLWKVSDAIDDAIHRAHQFAATQQMTYKETEDVPANIDLKSLRRMEWLLTKLTRRDMSGLFDEVDEDYHADLGYINDIAAAKTTPTVMM